MKLYLIGKNAAPYCSLVSVNDANGSTSFLLIKLQNEEVCPFLLKKPDSPNPVAGWTE